MRAADDFGKYPVEYASNERCEMLIRWGQEGIKQARIDKLVEAAEAGDCGMLCQCAMHSATKSYYADLNLRRRAVLMAEMVAQGAAIDRFHSHGWTPLMKAAAANQLEAINLCLDFGAAIDLADDVRVAAAAAAASVAALVEASLRSPRRDAAVAAHVQTGLTPLMYAVMHDSVDGMRLLIGRGAAIDAVRRAPHVNAPTFGHIQ